MAGISLLIDDIRSRKSLNVWVHWSEDWRWGSAGFDIALEGAVPVVVAEPPLRSDRADIWCIGWQLISDSVDLGRQSDWSGVRANGATNKRRRCGGDTGSQNSR